MKRLAIVVFAGVSVGLGFACSRERISESSNPVETFRQMTQTWEDATQARDVDRVSQIEADDWRSINHDGTVSTKEDDLNGLRTGKDKHVVAEFGPIDVKMLGDDVAVVNGTMSDKSATNDDGTRPTYAYMDVWVKRGGKWVVVRSQAFKVN